MIMVFCRKETNTTVSVLCFTIELWEIQTVVDELMLHNNFVNQNTTTAPNVAPMACIKKDMGPMISSTGF